jgi:hypothetical protein
MEKIKYEFDPYSRLTASNSALRGARKVLDGQFRISGSNTLTYHIKSPIPAYTKVPRQLKLKGEWSLAQGHHLRFTLDKLSRKTFGDELTLQGEIIDVRKNSLLFAVTTKRASGLPSLYTLELSGLWQADERNRLTFRVDKGNGRVDPLTFDGAWQINENFQITYSCHKEELLRKKKRTQSLVFDGHWDIKDKARLSYVMDSDTGSRFDFKTGVGIFKSNYIQYELGIGLSRKKRPVRRVITLFGGWRLNKNIGLVFEVGREGRKTQVILFGAEAKLKDKGNVAFSLRNALNKGMGVELELSRDILNGDGQVFLRLLGSKQESAILAGAGWRW